MEFPHRERVLRLLLIRVRPAPRRDFGHTHIGNLILTEPFFLPEEEWLPAPADWSAHIVRGKTYSTEQGEGARLWGHLLPVLARDHSHRHEGAEPLRDKPAGPMYGEPVPVRRRLGQGAFSLMVADVYGRRCAITGERAVPNAQRLPHQTRQSWRRRPACED